MSIPHTEEDEQAVLTAVTDIERDLFVRLLAHPAIPANAPRFGRWMAIHAVADLLTRLMLSAAMDPDPTDTRARCLTLLRAMEERIAPLPSSPRPN